MQTQELQITLAKVWEKELSQQPAILTEQQGEQLIARFYEIINNAAKAVVNKI